MSLSRRDFIARISSASLVLLGGGVVKLNAHDLSNLSKKANLRFVIASDGHYGEQNTNSDEFYQALVENVTKFHQNNKVDFCVINGDIIHDRPEFLEPAKQKLDMLPVKYYVTKGNHDRVNETRWNEVWGMPFNHEVRMKKNTFLLANTSNEQGKYLSPDIAWLTEKLNANNGQDNVFIFMHIPQAKWTANAIETPALIELLKKYKNVRGVFHGHEHDQDNVIMWEGVPCMFDSHFGGSWGTSYRGFRVVELVGKNSYVTYIMNPTERINQAEF